MATVKEKKIVSATSGEDITKEAPKKSPKQAAPVGNASGLRIGAVVLWVLAIVFEVLAILVVAGKVDLKFCKVMVQLIAFLVLDLACVIAGSQLWKKANHIKPASEANKVKFWLWNNMGVIVAAFAFVPFIILVAVNKNVDKKTKTVAIIVAVVALLIGGLFSYDFNPVSQEQQQAAINALGSTNVFWSPFGKVYHTSQECSALNQSEELTYGTVEQAIAAGRTRLCSFCAKRDSITGVTTDEKDVTE